jgi:tetratricopeptide (TPR) repeat protein
VSTPDPDALARDAMQALHADDPRKAREMLFEAVRGSPGRADLIHALGSVHLQLGEPELGLPLLQQALRVLDDSLARDSAARESQAPLREGILLALAAAAEDLDQPDAAEATYRQLLAEHPNQPRSRQALAHLLLTRGQVDAGRAALQRYVDEGLDGQDFLAGSRAFLDALAAWIGRDVHPRELIAAHRGSYVEMFDHYAAMQAKHGWVAEAARMRRMPEGGIAPVIPDGARPYAAVRVDLVDPATSEVGQVGDQPMVVGLAGFEPLAQAPVLFAWPGWAFPVRVSTQAPWDQLPLQIRFTTASPAALEALDGVIGDWYRQGFDGAFGTPDGQRFHYISDPEPRRGGSGVVYHLDGGRARDEAIDALLRRMEVLHATHPVAEIVIGRGHLGGLEPAA